MSSARRKKSSARSGGRLRSLDVLQRLLPGFWAESEDVARGVRSDAGEHVAQVIEGVHAMELARGEQRVDDASAFGAAFGSGKEPVLSFMRSSA